MRFKPNKPSMPSRTPALALSMAAALMLSLTACQQTKNLDEMHDNTEQMNKTTTKMNGQMGDMNQTTREMKDTTKDMNQTMDKMSNTMDTMSNDTSKMSGKMDNLDRNMTELKQETVSTMKKMDSTLGGMQGDMKDVVKATNTLGAAINETYDSLRQGNGALIRKNALDGLASSKELKAKMDYAGIYFNAFEFQLWNNLPIDQEPNRRDTLIHQAIHDFYMFVEGHLPKSRTVSINANPSERDVKMNTEENRVASFNAISAAMSESNRKQAEALTRMNNNSLQVYSMLTLTKEAIMAYYMPTAETDQLSDTRKKAYIELRAHLNTALLLIQTRYSFLPVALLNRWAGLSKAGLQVGFIDIPYSDLIERAWKTTVGWTLDIAKTDFAEEPHETLDYLREELLEPAIADRDFLMALYKKTGQERFKPKMSWVTQGLLNNMNVINIPDENDKSEITKSRLKFLEALKNLKDGMNAE